MWSSTPSTSITRESIGGESCPTHSPKLSGNPLSDARMGVISGFDLTEMKAADPSMTARRSRIRIIMTIRQGPLTPPAPGPAARVRSIQ